MKKILNFIVIFFFLGIFILGIISQNNNNLDTYKTNNIVINSIKNGNSSDRLIKNIFDKTNSIEGYKNELNKIHSAQIEVQKIIEKSATYNIQEINKSRNTFKTEMMLFIKDDKPIERLINEINNLLSTNTIIDKNFYIKLYDIQINRYDKQEEDFKRIMYTYGNEQEKKDFKNILQSTRDEFIINGTNKNILDNFN